MGRDAFVLTVFVLTTFVLTAFVFAVFDFAVFGCAVLDFGPLTAGSLDRTEKTGNAPMGDRGVSTWESLRWGTDCWESLRAEDGGSSRFVLVCESMHEAQASGK